MRSLVLLTNMFPFGTWEPYLETEVEHLTSFDQVHVCALSVRPEVREQRRAIANPKVQVHAIPFRSRAFYAFNTVRALGDRNLWRELVRLARGGRLSPGRVVALLVFMSRAHHEAEEIYRRLGGTVTDPLIYSYRFAYQPYVAELLRRRFGSATLVARGHRSDLYEELVPGTAYIPLREEVMRLTDTVYAISQDGADYLTGRFPHLAHKVRLRRLGTTDHGLGPVPDKGDPIRLVSCSTMTPVKRLDLLIAALRELPAGSFHWTHFGDGPLRDEIARLASKLPDGSWEFRGHVSNSEILEAYRDESFSAIVNVSASEGLPVSLMEAASYGVPIVATDVGGNREIVKTGVNGFLLGPDPTPQEVALELWRLQHLPYDAYLALRRGARGEWVKTFRSDVNYAALDKELATMPHATGAP